MKTRLRISCLLLAALMLFALAACGKDSPEPSPTPEGTEQTKPPAQPAAESTIHTPLWDLSYDEADGWVYEEDDFYDDEDFSKIILVIPDEADGSEVINAEIRVSVEGPYNSPALALTNTNMRSIRPMTLPKSAALTASRPKETIGGLRACGILAARRAPVQRF